MREEAAIEFQPRPHRSRRFFVILWRREKIKIALLSNFKIVHRAILCLGLLSSLRIQALLCVFRHHLFFLNSVDNC